MTCALINFFGGLKSLLDHDEFAQETAWIERRGKLSDTFLRFSSDSPTINDEDLAKYFELNSAAMI